MKWKVTQSQREELKEFGTSDNGLCWRNRDRKTRHKGQVHCCTIESSIKCHLQRWAIILKGLSSKFYTILTASQQLKMVTGPHPLLTNSFSGRPKQVRNFPTESWKCQLRKLMFLQNQNNFERLLLMFSEGLQIYKLSVNLTSLLQLFFILKFSLVSF